MYNKIDRNLSAFVSGLKINFCGGLSGKMWHSNLYSLHILLDSIHML